MAVLDGDGLVGRVTQVSDAYAIVLLVTDPSSGVAATLARAQRAPPGLRARSRRPASGQRLQLLLQRPAGARVRRGEPVVTQAYQGSVFPAGLPIGVV